MRDAQAPARARIVGYHRVTDSPNPNLHEWAVTPTQFEEQVRFLAESGYEAITCSELLHRFKIRSPMDRVVAITFDDGYLDTVQVAAPILARYGFVSTVFAVAGLMGATAEWDARYGGEMAPLAMAQELKGLIDLGWEIGHHTITHAALTALDDEGIRHEVIDGLDLLTEAIGTPIHTFAYPFSRQDERVRNLLVNSPFTGLFAAGIPFATPDSPREAIERIFVLDRHSLADLKLLLDIGMDQDEARARGIATE